MSRPWILGIVAALGATLGSCGRPEEASLDPAVRTKRLGAYDRGLDFLVTKAKDGVIQFRNFPHAGMTGLAVLPFLKRPGGRREKDAAFIEQALDHVAASITPAGDVDAGLTTHYTVSVIVMALAEAKRPQDAAALRRAVDYIRSVQHSDPGSPFFGGMGAKRDDTRADLSITYYAVMGLAAAGVPREDPFFQRALTFLQRSQNRKANETPGEPTQWTGLAGEVVVRGDDGGAVSWPGLSKAGLDTVPGGANTPRSYGSVTHALVHCYELIGLERSDGRVQAALDWIGNHWAVDVNPGMPQQFPEKQKTDGLYYYYASVGMAMPALGVERLRMLDRREIDWRSELADALLAAQKADGSWQSRNGLWMESVSAVATSFALIALAPGIR